MTSLIMVYIVEEGQSDRLRDDSHKKQVLLGRFDWGGSHKISNETVRTTLLGRFAQNFTLFNFKKKKNFC